MKTLLYYLTVRHIAPCSLNILAVENLAELQVVLKTVTLP